MSRKVKLQNPDFLCEPVEPIEIRCKFVFQVEKLERPKRIVYGSDARFDSAPYHVQVMRIAKSRNGYTVKWCGGSLISPNYVLTAAHCLETTLKQVTVVLGSLRFDLKNVNEARTLISRNLIRHKNYGFGSYGFDIGLVELSESVPFSNDAHAIVLPTFSDRNRNYDLEMGTVCGRGSRVSGFWDAERVGGFLQCANVTISLTECLRYPKMASLPNVLCVRGWGMRTGQVSKGDEGGGLVINGVLVGIMSQLVNPNDSPYNPSLFTKVTRHLKWIQMYSDVAIK